MPDSFALSCLGVSHSSYELSDSAIGYAAYEANSEEAEAISKRPRRMQSVLVRRWRE